MARTHQTRDIEIYSRGGDAGLEYLAMYGPEADSQVWLAGWPVIMASGKVTEWVNAAGGLIWGFALADGQNATTGLAPAKFVPAYNTLLIEANFMGSSAADNVLAAGDLGGQFDLTKDANLIGSVDGWFILDASSEDTVTVVAFETAHTLPTADAYQTAAGDTNARVRAVVTPGKGLWY